MKQKAQITIFIILGIFLLLTAMLVIYLVYTQTKVELKTFPKEALDNIQKIANNCLEQKTTESINLLTNQGGVIYTDQNGLTEKTDVEFASGGVIKLVKLVLFGKDFPPQVSTITPIYPWTIFPWALEGDIGKENKKMSTAHILFGMNALQPLDKISGQASWKSQIETKVKKEFLNCMNAQQLQGITITTQTPEITLTMTDKDVSVSSSEISLRAPDGTTATLQNIKAKIPIALMKFHEMVKKVIDDEVFNIENKLTDTPGVTEEKPDDTTVRIIKDKLVFNFAIPNRYPALEFIPDETSCKGSTVEILNNKITINPPEETPLGATCLKKSIELKAKDPDDLDALTYEMKILSQTDNEIKIKASVKDARGFEDSQEIKIKST